MSTPASLVIHHADILLPAGEWMQGDVRVQDGTIVEIAPSSLQPQIER